LLLAADLWNPFGSDCCAADVDDGIPLNTGPELLPNSADPCWMLEFPKAGTAPPVKAPNKAELVETALLPNTLDPVPTAGTPADPLAKALNAFEAAGVSVFGTEPANGMDPSGTTEVPKGPPAEAAAKLPNELEVG